MEKNKVTDMTEEKMNPIEKFVFRLIGNPIELLADAITKPKRALILLGITGFFTYISNSESIRTDFMTYFASQMIWFLFLGFLGFDFTKGDVIKFLDSKWSEMKNMPMDASKAIILILAAPIFLFLVFGIFSIIRINIFGLFQLIGAIFFSK